MEGGSAAQPSYSRRLRVQHTTKVTRVSNKGQREGPRPVGGLRRGQKRVVQLRAQWHTPHGENLEKGKGMQKDQRVADMAIDVLARQAGGRAQRTGEAFEEALKAVLETEAGRQLVELRDGPHRDEEAKRWQEDLARQRGQERNRTRQEGRRRARQEERSRARLAAWKSFVQGELRELELRKDGQLAGLLGEPLPGESPAALRRLASEDRRQAEEGLVALMSNGEVFYKHIEELSEEDMPARDAVNRARMTWLKERRDAWLGQEEEQP